MESSTLKRKAEEEARVEERRQEDMVEAAERDPEWLPTPEMLEAARRYAGSHGFPGTEGYDGTEEPAGPVMKTLEWVREHGWPPMGADGFVDLREAVREGGGAVAKMTPAEEVPGPLGVPAEDSSEAAEVTSEPGEQGVATSEPAVDTGGYEPPEPGSLTADELDLAGDLVGNLRERAQQMDVKKVIEDLVDAVDVHPSLRTPETWPGEADEEYREAPVVREIGAILCRGCPNLEVSAGRVAFLWRHRKSWTKKGKKVLADPRSHSKYAKFLSEGVVAAVQVHYDEFRHLNPLQKVFTVYRALRRLDAKGASIPPHFEGFKDELELFGGRAFREFVVLRAAAEAAKERESDFDAFQLSLLEGASE